MPSTLKEEIRRYLSNNGWRKFMGYEEEVFYKKRPPSKIQQFEFLRYSKRKIPYNPLEIADRLKDFFLQQGFIKLSADTPFGKYSDDPIFLTSGVQHFTDWFHRKVKPDNDEVYIEQPVIRTNLRDAVGQGRISSFVNLSTLKPEASYEEHIRFIDLWMQSLSQLGLFLGDFNLELKDKNIKDGKSIWDQTQGINLKFKYGGLEIGSAGAIYLFNNRDRPLSDIGFGLERIIWATNKTDDFSDILGPKPFSFSNDYTVLDSLRSLTLLAMSGLSKEDKDRYRQFRLYLQNIEKEPLDITAIQHYYSFWSKFLCPKRDQQETTLFFFTELNKFRNQKLLEKLGFEKLTRELQKHITEDTDSFIDYLVRNDRIKLEKIKELQNEKNIFVKAL